LPEKESYICIGKIVKSVGLKGGLKVNLLTDFPERFLELKQVFLFDETSDLFYRNREALRIINCNLYKSFAVIMIEGIVNRDQADNLRNYLVMIPEHSRIKLPEDKFYYYEVIGCDVYNRGELIGKVDNIVNYGSGDLLSIKSSKGEILIPIRDEFIVNIDTAGRRIDADLIEGFC